MLAERYKSLKYSLQASPKQPYNLLQMVQYWTTLQWYDTILCTGILLQSISSFRLYCGCPSRPKFSCSIRSLCKLNVQHKTYSILPTSFAAIKQNSGDSFESNRSKHSSTPPFTRKMWFWTGAWFQCCTSQWYAEALSANVNDSEQNIPFLQSHWLLKHTHKVCIHYIKW